MEQYIKNISTFFAVNEDSDESIIYSISGKTPTMLTNLLYLKVKRKVS